MTLDKTFAAEIRKATLGDGSAEHMRSFKRELNETARGLSTPKIEKNLDKYIAKYGRVKVAICMAATIMQNADRLTTKAYDWAAAVLGEWQNPPTYKLGVYYTDKLHPSKLDDYGRSFMRLTTEVA